MKDNFAPTSLTPKQRYAWALAAGLLQQQAASEKTVAKARAANKVARKQRRVNRRRG